MSDDRITERRTVTFEVEPGQVWIDPQGVSWYVEFIIGDVVCLHRKVTSQRTLRDLVRCCRRPNEDMPENNNE